MDQVFQEIKLERANQDLKWGVQNHEHLRWLGIAMEELGEAAEKSLEMDPKTERLYSEHECLDALEYEVIQAAAVCVAWLECLKRNRHPKPFEGKVYLAGPILDCDDMTINAWRSIAKTDLKLKTLDPSDRVIQEDGAIAEEIVEPDKKDIIDCDIVLANCWKPSAGTSMEILYAWSLGKTIVSVVPKPQMVSAWISYHSNAVCRTIPQAIKQINESFTGSE